MLLCSHREASSVTTSREPMPLAGSAGSCPGAVAPAPAKLSDSSTAERSARAATRWVHGRDRTHCTQPDGEVSDQFGFVSEVGQIRERSLRSDRNLAVLTVNAGVLAGRSLAAYCGVLADMRSIAASGVFGAHEPFPTVSPVCGRRNKRSGSLLRLSADAEWSEAAAKLASQSSCAGGTVRKR